MYLDFKRKIGYIAHMRVGSRSTSDILLERGFSRVFGHHATPFRAVSKTGRWDLANSQQWFYDENVLDYTWYATVRNPFDLWLSFQHMFSKQYGKRKGILGTVELTPQFMKDFMYNYRGVVSTMAFLFPAFVELPQCNVLRHETLREDLQGMLETHELPLLEEDEFILTKGQRTAGKPLDSYRNYITTGAREYIETKWGHELDTFGYTW